MREGIASLLACRADLLLVAEAGDGRAAVEMFLLHRPDVTLMDLQMPLMTGIEALGAIRAQAPDARIIVLTTFKGDAQVLQALAAGAAGYLLKSMLADELLDAIVQVHAKRRYIPAEIALELAAHFGAAALTAREKDVLRLVALGNSNKRIALLLGLGGETVKAHVSAVLVKLDARDRTHAVTLAIRRGIIEP